MSARKDVSVRKKSFDCEEEKCFAGGEHVFLSEKHEFTVEKHMFIVGEHKIIGEVETFT